MSARADALFALPVAPQTAILLPGAEDWRRPLASAEIECRPPNARADLAVAPAPAAGRALAGERDAVILEGRAGGRRLTAAGYEVRSLVPLPDRAEPEALLPLGRRREVRYALDRSPPSAAWKRARNAALVQLLGAALVPPGLAPTRVASRAGGEPFLIAAARRRGLAAPGGWLLVPGQGDPLARGAFHLFAPGAAEPDRVLKFSRVPGHAVPFDADERGLGLVAEAGGAAAAHAPRLIGRLVEDGRHASVETAASGRSLLSLLASTASRGEKLAAIERIAGWIVELGRQSAQPAAELAPELDRLRDEVVGRWGSAGAGPALVDGLPPLAAVLQHNDLGSWNVIVAGDGRSPEFTVLDWEAARPAGLPLWDLWYFLADALGELEAAGAGTEGRVDHAARIFRGETEASPILFEWTRRAVASLDVPVAAVGAVATLCFLHHGLSHQAREAALGGRQGALETVAPRLARRWVADPGLGDGWDAWRRG